MLWPITDFRDSVAAVTGLELVDLVDAPAGRLKTLRMRRQSATNINALCPSGNAPTARVRRRISRMIRSSGLFVRIRLQCSRGKCM